MGDASYDRTALAMPSSIAESPPAHRPMFRSRRRRVATLALAAEIVGLAVFLGAGALGAAPWSQYFPGYHAQAQSSTPVSFFSARTAATGVAGNYGNGPWVPVSSVGINTHLAFTIPGPFGSSGSAGVYSGCTIVPVTSGSTGAVQIPAISGSVGQGLSPAWLFEFRSASGGTLLVTVISGTAALYGVTSGSGCPQYYPTALNISSGVIDSPRAVSVVNAWGGTAFLANFTGASAIFSVTGPTPSYGCYNGCYYGGGVPIPVSSNGSVPPVSMPGVDYSPPAWAIMYSTLPIFGSNQSLPGPYHFLDALVSAGNGTLLSLSVLTTMFYCGPLGCGGGPYPGPVMGPGGPVSTTGSGNGSTPPGFISSPPSMGFPGTGSAGSAPPTGGAGLGPFGGGGGGSAPVPWFDYLVVAVVLGAFGAGLALTFRLRRRAAGGTPAGAIPETGTGSPPKPPLDDAF